VEYFFNRFDQFQKPPFHPKWKEINLASSLTGWTRFRAAEELLAKPPAQAGERNLAPRAGADQDQDHRELFNQFRSWEATNPSGR
jgi:hypothetical protein